MLVFQMKKDGKAYIDNGKIVITVLGIVNGVVKLGFEADKSIPIHRDSVQKRVDEELSSRES